LQGKAILAAILRVSDGECWLAPTSCDISARLNPASFARAASSFTSTGNRFPFEGLLPLELGATSVFFLLQKRILPPLHRTMPLLRQGEVNLFHATKRGNSFWTLQRVLRAGQPENLKKPIRLCVQKIRMAPEKREVAITCRVPEPFVNNLVAGAWDSHEGRRYAVLAAIARLARGFCRASGLNEEGAPSEAGPISGARGIPRGTEGKVSVRL
jgi:hypothetical protein